jgi:hypothetical protein
MKKRVPPVEAAFLATTGTGVRRKVSAALSNPCTGYDGGMSDNRIRFSKEHARSSEMAEVVSARTAANRLAFQSSALAVTEGAAVGISWSLYCN